MTGAEGARIKTLKFHLSEGNQAAQTSLREAQEATAKTENRKMYEGELSRRRAHEANQIANWHKQ